MAEYSPMPSACVTESLDSVEVMTVTFSRSPSSEPARCEFLAGNLPKKSKRIKYFHIGKSVLIVYPWLVLIMFKIVKMCKMA